MIELYNTDCNEFMEEMMGEAFINLTVTSPPYNISMGYDKYRDNLDYIDYLLFLEKTFKNIYDLTVSCGRCCINIGDLKNGAISLTTDLINIMNKIGWLNYTRIIWDKKQTSPRTAWGSFLSRNNHLFQLHLNIS